MNGWRFGRFGLVGCVGAILQVALISLLTRLGGMHVVAATLVAVESAVLHNFVWHERFTWGGCDLNQRVNRLWRFHLGNGLISLVGNAVFMYLLVERLKAPRLVAAIGAIAACSCLNFLLADRWVYRRN